MIESSVYFHEKAGVGDQEHFSRDLYSGER